MQPTKRGVVNGEVPWHGLRAVAVHVVILYKGL